MKRYDLNDEFNCGMEESDDGDYVLFSDHQTDIVDIVRRLESAFKAKDEQLKLWEDANGQLEARLRELAEECLPYIAEEINYLIACAPVSQRDEAYKLAAKLKLLVNK